MRQIHSPGPPRFGAPKRAPIAPQLSSRLAGVRRPYRRRAEPTLSLSAEAGDVEVEAPWQPEAKGRERGMWIAVQNGILLPMPFLYQWVELQNGDRTALGREGRMKIGQLPPAVYQFCNVTMADLIAYQVTGALPAGAVCGGGALAAGGTLRLKVPKPSLSRE